jgi:hypothetical protein
MCIRRETSATVLECSNSSHKMWTVRCHRKETGNNVFNLYLVVEPFLHNSLWTQFVTAQSILFPSLPLTDLPYLKPLTL